MRQNESSDLEVGIVLDIYCCHADIAVLLGIQIWPILFTLALTHSSKCTVAF